MKGRLLLTVMNLATLAPTRHVTVGEYPEGIKATPNAGHIGLPTGSTSASQ